MWKTIPFFLSVTAGLLIQAGAASAQDFPVRTLRFVTGLGPGSGMDTNTRYIAERLQGSLKQPVVVETKTGANTLIATQAVLSAPADGYSILVISPGAMVMNPVRMPNVGYEPLRDLRFVGGLNTGASILVVSASSRFQTAAEFLRAAAIKPGQISLAYYSDTYQAGVRLLEEKAEVHFNAVPYKGASSLLPDLLGGAIDGAFVSASAAMKLIEAGKLKALAIASKERSRSASLSLTPTFRESGIKDFYFIVWLAFAVRANTPEPIVSTLRDAIRREVGGAQFREFLAAQAGEQPFLVDDGQFEAVIKNETRDFKRIASLLQ